MTEAASSSPYQNIVDLLSLQAGWSFDSGRLQTTEQAICQAMLNAGCSNSDEYLTILNADANAVDELLAATTDGETWFFRDAGQFRIVSDLVLPDIRRRRGPGHTIRIWSAGCGSGEEAYSLAILLHRSGALSQASLLGTDISRESLARARTAVYQESALRDESAEMAKPYLTKKAGQYHVNATMKRSVRFEHLNLARGNYPSTGSGTRGIDLIFCRNVLVQFDEQTVQSVVSRLFRSLAEGGWLIIAPSDPPVFEYEAFDFVPTDYGLAYRRANLSSADNQVSEPQAVTVETSAALSSPKTDVTPPATRSPATRSPATRSPASERLSNKAHHEARQALADGDFQLAADLTADLRGHGAIIHIKAMAGIDLSLAEQSCVAATKKRPFSQQLQYLRALLLIDLNRHKEAIEPLQRVLYLDESLARVHFSLGTVFRSLGDFSEAQRAFRTAIEICDRSPPDQTIPLGENETVGELRALAKNQLDAIE